MPNRCAIYVRKSTEHGLDMEFNSLQNQEESCKAYIASQAFNGWQYHKTYTDAAISGGTMERPALKQMLDDMARGPDDADRQSQYDCSGVCNCLAVSHGIRKAWRFRTRCKVRTNIVAQFILLSESGLYAPRKSKQYFIRQRGVQYGRNLCHCATASILTCFMYCFLSYFVV